MLRFVPKIQEFQNCQKTQNVVSWNFYQKFFITMPKIFLRTVVAIQHSKNQNPLFKPQENALELILLFCLQNSMLLSCLQNSRGLAINYMSFSWEFDITIPLLHLSLYSLYPHAYNCDTMLKCIYQLELKISHQSSYMTFQ